MPPVDLSKLSDADLDALEKRDLTKLSEEGLSYLENSSRPFVGPPELGPRDSVVAADGASDEEKQFIADYHAIADKAKNDPSILSRLYNRMKATGMESAMRHDVGPGGIPFSPEEISAREKALGEDNRLSPFAVSIPAAPVLNILKGAAGAAKTLVGKSAPSAAEAEGITNALKALPPSKAQEVISKVLANPVKTLFGGSVAGDIAARHLPVKSVAGAGAAGALAVGAYHGGIPEKILSHMIYERISKDPALSKLFGIDK